jgi:hypothetical protein
MTRRDARYTGVPARPASRLVLRLLPVLPFWAAGCITVEEPEDDSAALARSVVIPLQTAAIPSQHPLAQFYEGVLTRLHAAHSDGDLAGLEALLRDYNRPDAPDWARQRLHGYRLVALGMAFEKQCAATVRLENAAAAAQSIGDALTLDLVLEQSPERAVVLGGDEDPDPTRFQVRVDIEDRFVDGSVLSHEAGGVVALPAPVDLSVRELRLPIRFELPDSGAVRRTLQVRVDLVAGYVQVEGERAPIRGRTLASSIATQLPRGSEPIRAKPLATLREALRRGDPAHFPHVFLAATMTEGRDREAAIADLVESVRIGTPAAAQVAMATLHELTGAKIPIGDRDAWLAWGQARR